MRDPDLDIRQAACRIHRLEAGSALDKVSFALIIRRLSLACPGPVPRWDWEGAWVIGVWLGVATWNVAGRCGMCFAGKSPGA